jgi:hypothetical protein
VEPGLIGGEVNKILAAHQKKHNLPIQYKIGPDPSSIDSSMIGGIVANNSSGMCCGVSQNTYHTLKDMRVVFVDGTVLDTADPQSCANFMRVSRCCWARLRLGGAAAGLRRARGRGGGKEGQSREQGAARRWGRWSMLLPLLPLPACSAAQRMQQAGACTQTPASCVALPA